jgi:hypothetical protein
MGFLLDGVVKSKYPPAKLEALLLERLKDAGKPLAAQGGYSPNFI